MMKILRGILLPVLLMALPLMAQNDRVLLTVNGESVTRSEFVNCYMHSMLTSEGTAMSVNDYLERFIDNKVILAAARDAGYRLPETITNHGLRNTNNGSCTYTAALDVTEAEACYQQACKAAAGSDMLRLSQILLSVDTRASSAKAAAVKQRADSIYNALTAGADFATLASRLSDDQYAPCGGDMGWVGTCQLLEEVERGAWQLRAGEVSRPIQSPAGWHIVKVIDRQPATSDVVYRWFLTPRTARQHLDANPVDPYIIRELDEALVVFQMTQSAVWSKPAPDDKTLSKYFKKNRKRYGDKLKKRDFPAYRTQVLCDYRQHCEEEWVEGLRRLYKVKVDKSVLRTIE